MADVPYIWAVGRRKAAVARVRLYPGSGQDHRQWPSGDRLFRRPRDLSGFAVRAASSDRNTRRFDVTVRVVGGGVSGQVGAIRHGIARALVRSDEELRPTLKRAQLLTRDARVKERKKVGLKRARKAPQYTKR